jgi:hypothetical protein
MEEGTTSVATHEDHELGALTVATIVGASVLSGVGIFGMMFWLITFRWLYFLSVVPLVVGCYLLFTRATGADHA